MPEFVQGLMLARDFYKHAVRPLIKVPHAAALIGEGSEVLQFDQPRSTDHAWGPRLQIFAEQTHTEELAEAVERSLPSEFMGWPVKFFSWQTNTVRHHIEINTLSNWVLSQIGLDPLAADLSTAAWLALPQQQLLQITAGEVFHDDTGDLHRLRRSLSWYPQDVWLWAMASQWHLIGNAEPRIGRAIEAGDRRGAILIATRLVRLLMELSFLQERRYWPYEKWFGTAFSQLAASPVLGPHLDAVLDARNDAQRIGALHMALLLVAERHNALGVTPRTEPVIDDFRVGINDAVRPYRVMNAGRFVEACRNAITDMALRRLVTVGIFDQLTHGDDALVNFTPWPRQISTIYGRLLSASIEG